MHLKMSSALMADSPPKVTLDGSGDYKALVCLFYNGAIDSFNVLTPYGTTATDSDYLAYYNTRRSNSSVTRGPGETTGNGATLKRRADWDGSWPTNADYGYLNPIVDSGTGKTYGLHPQFSNLATIYNNGHATFIPNCGALVDRLRHNNDFINTSNITRKPIGLFSHPDQQRHWQTAVPTSRNEVKGWGGKISDLITDSANANIFTNVSVAGQSLFLTGTNIVPYTIGTGGAVPMKGYVSTPVTNTSPSNSYDRIFARSQQDYASQTYADILENTMRNTRKDARDAALAFQGSFTGTPVSTGAGNAAFPTTGVGAQLAAVAKTIKMAQTGGPIAQRRQIFLVQIGGWDHHANLLASQKNMIGGTANSSGIDNGLFAFYNFLSAEGLLSNVTTFSISDFSRTWSFNGSGTDHGWGANTMVMGGAVNGGRFWGTPTTQPAASNGYPVVTVDTSGTGRDRGRGVIIPSTAADEYHDVLARWFGIPDGPDLQTVLPNIRNFRSQGSNSAIPFMTGIS